MYQVSLIAKPTKFVVVPSNVTKEYQLEIKQRTTYVQNENGIYTLYIDDMEPLHVNGDDGFSQVSWGQIQGQNGPIKFIVCSQKSGFKAPVVLSGPFTEMELWYDALRYIVASTPPETETSKKYLNYIVHGFELPNSKESTPEVPPPPEDVNF